MPLGAEASQYSSDVRACCDPSHTVAMQRLLQEAANQLQELCVSGVSSGRALKDEGAFLKLMISIGEIYDMDEIMYKQLVTHVLEEANFQCWLCGCLDEDIDRWLVPRLDVMRNPAAILDK